MHDGADTWIDLCYHVLEWLKDWGWKPLLLAGFGAWTAFIAQACAKTGNWPWSRRRPDE